MPKKQIKKKSPRTKAKSPPSKKAKRRAPSGKAPRKRPIPGKRVSARKPTKKTSRSLRRAPSKKSPRMRAKLKKSVARKAIRSAVAKRATGKSHSKKAISKSSRKQASKKTKASKNPLKKSAKKTASKVRKSRSKKSDSVPNEPVSKPQTKSERLGGELNRAEISKLLSDRYTRHLVIESGGEYALEIIRGFANNSSDEDMAKKLKIKISDVRATLNKLHSLGVVDYTRHKDSETGWFSYYWFLNVERMKEWVNKKIDEDHRRMDFSNGEHYYCPGCGGASIHNFVSASDFGFKCPTCSSSLDFLSEEKANDLFPMRSFRKPLL